MRATAASANLMNVAEASESVDEEEDAEDPLFVGFCERV